MTKSTIGMTQTMKHDEHPRADRPAINIMGVNLCKPVLSIFILMFSALLAWRGYTLLLLPPIYHLAHQGMLLHYEGYLLIALAVALALSHRLVAAKLVWISQEIHRMVSALLMASAIGIDAMMHVFSIPHMEGWWLPLFGGGALVSSVGAWLHQWRKKPDKAST